jgi:hypothetical protein
MDYPSSDMRSFDPHDAESWAKASHVLFNLFADICFDGEGRKRGIPEKFYQGLDFRCLGAPRRILWQDLR